MVTTMDEKRVIETTYDEINHLVYKKCKDKSEWWFDLNGKLVRRKYANGHENWWDHDADGRLIHKKDSYGYEEWNEYNVNGKIIHKKEIDKSDYTETLYKYDQKNHLIYTKVYSGHAPINKKKI